MRETIGKIVREESEKLIKGSFQYGCFSEWHINMGWCYDLARSVSDRLKSMGIEHEVLDEGWLKRSGPKIDGKYPKGIGRVGAHEFIHADGVCYDSECPEGVDSPYDIPLVQYAMRSKDHEKALEDWIKSPNASGPMPSPSAVSKAVLETLNAFEDFEGNPDKATEYGFRTALQYLYEPLASYADPEEKPELLARILRSYGIDCEVVEGDPPEHYDMDEAIRYSWIILPTGSIIDVMFEHTAAAEKSRVGGRVTAMKAEQAEETGYRAVMPTFSI